MPDIEKMSEEEIHKHLAQRAETSALAATREAGERYAATHPVVGRWRVTTEGDVEGRTTRDLGVHVGHVADIAATLAPLVHYGLDFRPEPEPKTPTLRGGADISVAVHVPDAGSAFDQMTPEHRAVFARAWFSQATAKHVVTLEVRESNHYGCVLLRMRPIR